MTFDIRAEPTPIHVDEHGVARVGGTRVTLETVLWAYVQGSSAEQIAESFPTLELADIHAVIAYYLRHREEVDAYLQHVEAEGNRIRAEFEARYPRHEWREKLLARRRELNGE